MIKSFSELKQLIEQSAKPAEMDIDETLDVEVEEDQDFLTGIPACMIDDPDCESCQ